MRCYRSGAIGGNDLGFPLGWESSVTCNPEVVVMVELFLVLEGVCRQGGVLGLNDHCA
jgi:hypothetical protein